MGGQVVPERAVAQALCLQRRHSCRRDRFRQCANHNNSFSAGTDCTSVNSLRERRGRQKCRPGKQSACATATVTHCPNSRGSRPPRGHRQPAPSFSISSNSLAAPVPASVLITCPCPFSTDKET